MPEKYKILAIAGSLRSGSFNRSLLNAAIALAPAGIEAETFDIDGFPLYNEDVRINQPPEIVSKFKEKIRAADGLLIATPEYNHSIPGVLKNAIDWASRPPEDYPFTGKPVAIMGASTGVAGSLRAQLHLRQVLFMSNDMRAPEIIVNFAGQKFDSEGNLTDELTAQLLTKFMASFEKWIMKIKSMN